MADVSKYQAWDEEREHGTMLHIGAEPNERWIGVMPSCKAEVRHPFPVPLVCWQGSIHWEEGPGLGARDTGGKVQVPQPTCVRSSPGSKWALEGICS